MMTLLKVWKFAVNVLCTKYFYGLEKKNALRGTIKTLLEDGKEITSATEISLTLILMRTKILWEPISKSHRKVYLGYRNV